MKPYTVGWRVQLRNRTRTERQHTESQARVGTGGRFIPTGKS